VISAAYGALGPNVVKYGALQGFKPIWYVLSFNISPKFVELIPDSVRNNVISAAVVAVSKEFGVPGWEEYKKEMDKAGLPLGRTSAAGWTFAEEFTEALKRAGRNLTREKLVSAAETIHNWKCSLCVVPINLSSTEHWPFQKPYLLQIKNGEWVVRSIPKI
jgi:hypothetical protein